MTPRLHPSLEGRGQVTFILPLSLSPERGCGSEGRSTVISHVDHVWNSDQKLADDRIDPKPELTPVSASPAGCPTSDGGHPNRLQ